MIGINIGGISILYMHFSPGFENIGTAIQHGTVAPDQRGTLAHLHITRHNGQAGTIIYCLKSECARIVEDMNFPRGIAVVLPGNGNGFLRLTEQHKAYTEPTKN
jgi:hypothetical protein